jgi:hypothetical protein
VLGTIERALNDGDETPSKERAARMQKLDQRFAGGDCIMLEALTSGPIGIGELPKENSGCLSVTLAAGSAALTALLLRMTFLKTHPAAMACRIKV